MVKRRKPLLFIKHGKRRVDFALKYKNWTVEDWVHWKDVCVKKIRQAFIGQGIVKCGGGFLMIWEYMDWNGVRILVEMEGWMDAEQYVSILEDKLLPSMENSAFSKKSIIFQ